MKTLSLTARLTGAAAAVATTLTLFSAVVSLSEPDRGMLIAKSQPARLVPQSSPAAVAVAFNDKAAPTHR